MSEQPIYSCDHCAPIRGAYLPYGYIDETWPTISGGGFRYMSCFQCRGTVVPFDRNDLRWTRVRSNELEEIRCY